MTSQPKPEIDGWEEITPEQAGPLETAQIVNGTWYIPIFGCDALQMALEGQQQSLLDEVKEKVKKHILSKRNKNDGSDESWNIRTHYYNQSLFDILNVLD